MPVSSRKLVEFILLGPSDDRRQLQDSPILADVWIAFAEQPDEPMDLLITPHWERSAGKVASEIRRRIGMSRKSEIRRVPKKDRKVRSTTNIAYLQGVVAARLYFDELLRVVVPLTDWWKKREVLAKLIERSDEFLGDRLTKNLSTILDWAETQDIVSKRRRNEEELKIAFLSFTALDRYLALAALISWSEMGPERGIAEVARDQVGEVVGNFQSFGDTVRQDLTRLNEDTEPKVLVWQVSMNRTASPALAKSVPAVKADAARTLFSVNCSQIYWAVIDSGIDDTHPAFNDDDGKSRIVKRLDFTGIRQIVNLDNLDADVRKECAEELARTGDELTPEIANDALKKLADDADNERPILWEEVEKLVRIPPGRPPYTSHGTHVAGIIGANSTAALEGAKTNGQLKGLKFADGMCRDIRLYDLRVLAKTIEDTEFAVIAALQYLRYLKERHIYVAVHGVNLSLSIPHDVRNFACGRTPVCNECERLVENGIVVVAAAGNRGYQSYETKEGSYEGYTAFSITDPGNADGVITVGSTHRSWPHTYGVSFFSSRGPTGDGRLKPDLVAPGERIEAPLPVNDGGWGELDGTSMSAPHVSGAAAMLMARYAELVERPRRIKQVLCEGATDLGRERSFQGNGMLDVLAHFNVFEEGNMLFSLDVRRARKGDCLILHFGSKDDPHLLLIDGGPSGVYNPHLKPRVDEIRKDRQLDSTHPLPVDALMVSHVDDDHIRGILDLTKELQEAKRDGKPMSVRIRDLWHNSFDEIVNGPPEELTGSIKKQFGPASVSGGELSDDEKGEVEEHYAKINPGAGPDDEREVVSGTLQVLASIEQGHRLRSDAKGLDIPINNKFGKKLIQAVENGKQVKLGDDLMLTVVGPMRSELLALQKKHDEWLKKLEAEGKSPSEALAAYVDKSVPNLSSIVMLAELDGRKMLLTGDARGDNILKGLELTGQVQAGGKIEVDLLKVPHHGSSNNLDNDFFERIIAKHYVFSGDGEHGNPERESMEMLFKARGDADYVIHLTYPIDEIDKGRKEDWEKEQGKEKKKKLKDPAKKVRPDWSPKDNGLRAFFDAHLGLEKKVQIVDEEKPHVIDLGDALGF